VNTSASIRRLTTLGAALAVAGALVSAQSQEPLETRVRDLYASAEYDQALSLLGNSQEPAAQQYRALCLLALGRQADAEAALEQLIASAPEFTVSTEDMPPRFVSLFAEQRREIVPGVLRRLFAEAREDYRAKAYDRALPQFKKVLTLSSEAEVRDLEGVADLRLLAESFIDIATAAEAPKPEVAASATPATATAAPRTADVPLRRPTLPAAIKQEMPPWPSSIPVNSPRSGSVRIRIDSNGRVVSAAMVRPIEPRYDARVLAATHFWEYKPATENGVPVEAESLVEITINPTR
jgi:tetratricopeptide (TPR) repeat protein